jgi:NTP pyrophosphatase (non-canonical NTP hydrolase)
MSKMNQKDYIEFVGAVTSDASKDYNCLINRLNQLKDEGADVSRLLTAALGVSAEGGELVEIVKKIFLQGKPYSEENIVHLKKEAGDVLWYMAQLCIALDTNFEELMQLNFAKLSARYPEGTFLINRSENRVEGDI